MEHRLSAGLSFLTSIMFLCGCSSRHAGPAYHAGDENPPEFLTGPVASLLTNFTGFSAHVTINAPAPGGESRGKSGELLERNGNFIFQPTLQLKGKRARTEGGLFFIWNASRHSGYLLSDALQAYAPLKTESNETNPAPAAAAKPGIEEQIDGHPCHQRELVFPSDNGQLRVVLWEAEDARHFPIRIESIAGSRRTTLDFSELRMDPPPENLFQPPAGFSSYTSSVELMNELIVREASMGKKSSAEFDEPSDVRNQNWHPQTIGAP